MKNILFFIVYIILLALIIAGISGSCGGGCSSCIDKSNYCSSCDGMGKFKISETKWMTCPTCKGTGRKK